MEFILSDEAKNDIIELKKENAKYAEKLWKLILDIEKEPYSGLGKPEQLKGNLQTYWSRRITPKHRLIYRLTEENILEILSCFGHYDDK